MAIVLCELCGASNELPPEALARGQYRCHACGEVGDVPEELRLPRESPAVHHESSQTEPSFTPSQHNTPEAMYQAEREASRFGCLVGLVAGVFRH